MVEKYLHKFLWWLTETFPSRTRDISREGDLYLRRFYLTPRRKNKEGDDTESYMGFGIYLHYFYRGDKDLELHNHPWKRAVSFILTGGYYEERREPNYFGEGIHRVLTHNVTPGSFNIIGADDFHRIEKKPNVDHVWTLFFTGTRAQDWGFWNRNTGAYTPQAEFVSDEDQGYGASS